MPESPHEIHLRWLRYSGQDQPLSKQLWQWWGSNCTKDTIKPYIKKVEELEAQIKYLQEIVEVSI